MLKSQKDIDAQAERIIAMAKGTHRFMCCKKGEVDKAAIYKLARTTKSQHGFSIFDTDKDTKRECIHPYVNRMEVHRMWWQDENGNMKKFECKPVVTKPKQRALTDEERLQLEVTMNDVCNHQMMKKVLAWIACDMNLKVNLGLPGDPYEVPRWMLQEAKRMLPAQPKQLTLQF